MLSWRGPPPSIYIVVKGYMLLWDRSICERSRMRQLPEFARGSCNPPKLNGLRTLTGTLINNFRLSVLLLLNHVLYTSTLDCTDSILLCSWNSGSVPDKSIKFSWRWDIHYISVPLHSYYFKTLLRKFPYLLDFIHFWHGRELESKVELYITLSSYTEIQEWYWVIVET